MQEKVEGDIVLAMSLWEGRLGSQFRVPGRVRDHVRLENYDDDQLGLGSLKGF